MQITVRKQVGAFRCVVRAPVELEGEGVAGDVLEPGRDGILRPRLGDRRLGSAASEQEDDSEQASHEDRVEAKQPRMVEGQHDQSDDRLQQRCDPIEEERRRRLLHGHDLEEAIHQLGPVRPVMHRLGDARQAPSEVGGDAGENP